MRHAVTYGMLTLLLAAASTASAETVQWLRSAEQAAVASADSGKPILIYVRSASCYYCDMMQKNVWEDATTAKLIMRDFVPLKLTREENAEAVESLKVKGFPTTMVFSPQRAYIGRIDGYVEPDEFLAAMQKARLATGPTKLQR